MVYSYLPILNGRYTHAYGDHLMQSKDTYASYAFFKHAVTPHTSRKSDSFFVLHAHA